MPVARRVAIGLASVIAAPGVIVATAAIALDAVTARRRIAIAIAVAGFVAACALEFELWDEAERVLPFGLLFGPYVAWVAAAFFLRRFPPPAQGHWADTRF